MTEVKKKFRIQAIITGLPGTVDLPEGDTDVVVREAFDIGVWQDTGKGSTRVFPPHKIERIIIRPMTK